MALVRRGKVWHYDFWFGGRRFQGTTRQRDRFSAQEVETKLQTRLRRQAAGLEPMEVVAPAFADWAEVAYAAHAKTLRRPEAFETHLRMALRFWGRRPTAPDQVDATAPYHDLTLQAPISDPSWLLRFEQWLEAQGWAAGTKNHLRSACSLLYQIALQPAYRLTAGVSRNPFADLPRDRARRRTATVTLPELRQWIAGASYHVRLAVAIGALAPKLRLAEVLALRWATHLDADWTWITVREHKTSGAGAPPHVVPVTAQLRVILEDARRRAPFATHVVTYRGKPVESIRDGVRNAARAAGLPYGRDRDDGVTYHTLRHVMATWLAELAVPEAARAEALGHRDLATTQRYTHLRPVHQRPVLEQLSAAVPISDVVVSGPTRAKRATRE